MSKIINRIRHREAMAEQRELIQQFQEMNHKVNVELTKFMQARDAEPARKAMSGGQLFEHIALGIAIAMTAYLLTH